MSNENKWKEQFREIINPESLIIIGLGNTDRADDGAGIQIVAKIKARFPGKAFSEIEQSVEGLVLECLEDPSIKSILFIDAVDFQGKPGQVRLFGFHDTVQFIPAISTHKVPLTLLMELIEKHEKDAFLLGIQPRSVQLFGKMSDEVQTAIQDLEKLFNDFIS